MAIHACMQMTIRYTDYNGYTCVVQVTLKLPVPAQKAKRPDVIRACQGSTFHKMFKHFWGISISEPFYFSENLRKL